MLDYLESEKMFRADFIDKNTLKGEIENVKVDLITHSYPLVNDLIIMEDIRMASLEDISARKLNAIAGNGTQLKDFIDIAFLSCYLSQAQMINAYERKYSLRNPVMLIKGLLYLGDINFSEPIKMVNTKYSWKSIEKRLREMEKQPLLIFQELPVA
jgi:hypothetical protein